VCESWVPSSRFIGVFRRTRNCNAHASEEGREKALPRPKKRGFVRGCHAARALPDTDVPAPGRCVKSTMVGRRLHRRAHWTGLALGLLPCRGARMRRTPAESRQIVVRRHTHTTGVAQRGCCAQHRASKRSGAVSGFVGRLHVLPAPQCHAGAWHTWCKAGRTNLRTRAAP